MAIGRHKTNRGGGGRPKGSRWDYRAVIKDEADTLRHIEDHEAAAEGLAELEDEELERCALAAAREAQWFEDDDD